MWAVVALVTLPAMVRFLGIIPKNKPLDDIFAVFNMIACWVVCFRIRSLYRADYWQHPQDSVSTEYGLHLLSLMVSVAILALRYRYRRLRL